MAGVVAYRVAAPDCPLATGCSLVAIATATTTTAAMLVHHSRFQIINPQIHLELKPKPTCSSITIALIGGSSM